MLCQQHLGHAVLLRQAGQRNVTGRPRRIFRALPWVGVGIHMRDMQGHAERVARRFTLLHKTIGSGLQTVVYV